MPLKVLFRSLLELLHLRKVLKDLNVSLRSADKDHEELLIEQSAKIMGII
jgi:hypothetical protein